MTSSTKTLTSPYHTGNATVAIDGREFEFSYAIGCGERVRRTNDLRKLTEWVEEWKVKGNVFGW